MVHFYFFVSLSEKVSLLALQMLIYILIGANFVEADAYKSMLNKQEVLTLILFYCQFFGMCQFRTVNYI